MTVHCERVDLDYFDAAPVRFKMTREIAATPERVFDVFLDAESWTKWVVAITKVEWTSPFPLEVGSTRTVSMMGGLKGYEEFIAWEYGRRMAFRFNETTRGGVSAFAEDYQVTPIGDERSSVEWTMAMTPSGVSKVTMPIVRPVMGLFLNRTLGDFATYVESSPVLAADAA